MNSTFATLGTIGGGAAGYYTTRALMGTDRAAYERTAQKGLKESTDGQVVDWQSPDTGNSGIFRPIRSFRLADGRYCRQYRTTVSFDKTVHSGNGMACRNANGQWQVVSDDFS
ncbi:MAG TPA: RT0821/Lpp0805 family surface protein [Rhodospirillales bacterium]|nr:RT0821/Lpp0805 family surface protein [Rhodospirillales bacterium]